ncbi:MAG: AAA family ATPase [bacterium]|nr:AAA family ATPase [bacterium]
MSETAEKLARLQGLEAHLRRTILGQDHVLPRIASIFVRGELGLADPARPRGSLLLCGPTGTGKTETVTCATHYAFGPGHLACFDMSEYQDKAAVNKLLGEDRSDGGLLGQVLLTMPTGTLLFDEIEKAHTLVLDLFLQMLWHARITVASGRTFDLSGHYVAFTSNLGGAEAMRMEQSKLASVEQAVLRRVGSSFRPELVARIDEKLVFARLSSEVQREICGLVVKVETARLRGLGYDLEVSREALDFLVREGHDPLLGARPMRRAVEGHLQRAVVASLMRAGTASGQVVVEGQGTSLLINPA